MDGWSLASLLIVVAALAAPAAASAFVGPEELDDASRIPVVGGAGSFLKKSLS